MKHVIISLVFLFPVFGFAQPKKQSPAKQQTATTLTKADANKLVAYVNNLSEFLQTKCTDENFLGVLDRLSENISKKDKSMTIASRLRGNLGLYSPFVELVQDFKEGNEDKVVITNVPACSGAESVAKLKLYFAQYATESKTMDSAAKKVFDYLDDNFALKNMNDMSAFKANVDQMYHAYDNMGVVKNNIYDVIGDLGDRAEEVTLAKHPMKTEIMDMKKELRLTRVCLDLMMVDDVEKLKGNFLKLDETTTTMKTVRAKYGDQYNVSLKGISMESKRANVKNVFESVDAFLKIMDNLKTLVNGSAKKEMIDREQKSAITKYELLVSDFNSFVNDNNG
jgi:hypothetical protein